MALREAHAHLVEVHRRIELVYAGFDRTYDYDREGESHTRFHPSHLPPAHTLLPISEMGSENDYLEHAQRRWSQIVHHSAWLSLLTRLHGVSRREAVRFISVSQPHAGDFLNAVPKHAPYRLPTWAMRLVVRRRLGLPIALVDEHRLSKHGKQFDAYGDRAQNDGKSGHQTRHFLLLDALVAAARSVWGALVQREPADYTAYSNYRPDFAADGQGKGGGKLVADLKLFDSVGGDGEPDIRGSLVAMGNTLPHAREMVHGLRGRGQPGDGAWRWAKGHGYVARSGGAYARARKAGCDIRCLLFETWGGWSPDTVELFRELAEQRSNRLHAHEYDETTWSARTWLSHQAQKISVALQYAVALELSNALGLATASDSGI